MNTLKSPPKPDWYFTLCGPLERRVRHSPELSFTIVAVPHDYHVEYSIYDIEGFGEGEARGVYDRPLWHQAGAAIYPSTVDTLEEAEPYLHGSVKWDGCSNWHFDMQDRVMLHGCSRENVQRFGDVMTLCWDWTAELCPHWNA